MKKRIIPLVLALALLLSLAGCAKAPAPSAEPTASPTAAPSPEPSSEPTLAEDFTIGGAEWGAGYESVRALLGDAEELENGMRLSKKGVTFFGQKADIDYVFAKVDGAAKLNAVAVIFEPDFDKDAVVAGVSEVLGEIDKTIVSSGGAILSVEEPLWKWHDDETVGMKYLHTAAFGEYLTLTGSRPAFVITYNGLWN